MRVFILCDVDDDKILSTSEGIGGRWRRDNKANGIKIRHKSKVVCSRHGSVWYSYNVFHRGPPSAMPTDPDIRKCIRERPVIATALCWSFFYLKNHSPRLRFPPLVFPKSGSPSTVQEMPHVSHASSSYHIGIYYYYYIAVIYFHGNIGLLHIVLGVKYIRDEQRWNNSWITIAMLVSVRTIDLNMGDSFHPPRFTQKIAYTTVPEIYINNILIWDLTHDDPTATQHF